MTKTSPKTAAAKERFILANTQRDADAKERFIIANLRRAVDTANDAADSYRDAIMLAYHNEHDPNADDFDDAAEQVAYNDACDKAHDLYAALYNAARITADAAR